MHPPFSLSQRSKSNKNHQTNPATENGAVEPRSGEEQQQLEQCDGREGPKNFFKKVVAHRTDFCVY